MTITNIHGQDDDDSNNDENNCKNDNENIKNNNIEKKITCAG